MSKPLTLNYRPSEIWNEAKHYISTQEECMLIIDDSTIDKRHSTKKSYFIIDIGMDARF